MSNEFIAWRRDGGACQNCIHNQFTGSDSVCVLKRPSHKDEVCGDYDTDEPIEDLLDALYRAGYEAKGVRDYDPRGCKEWLAVRSRFQSVKQERNNAQS